jgi:hypothetical protein
MSERQRNLAQDRYAQLLDQRRRAVAEQEARLERRREAARAEAEQAPEPEVLEITAEHDELNLRAWIARGIPKEDA